MNSHIQKAIEILNKNGIVIFPTDTAFGIGCRIDKPTAVDRLFKIRRRPIVQAMPILVSSITMSLTYYLDPSDIVRRFVKEYWPGALTIVAPCNMNCIDSPIRGGRETAGPPRATPPTHT